VIWSESGNESVILLLSLPYQENEIWISQLNESEILTESVKQICFSTWICSWIWNESDDVVSDFLKPSVMMTLNDDFRVHVHDPQSTECDVHSIQNRPTCQWLLSCPNNLQIPQHLHYDAACVHQHKSPLQLFS
jgi:hypothetical protein